MADFNVFKTAMAKHFETIEDNRLFMADVSKDEMWETYLGSFPEGSNLIYKERQEFDCQCCRQFIRAYGNIVAIVNNKMVSIWDIEGLAAPFDSMAKAMSDLIHSVPIKDIFVTKITKLGTDKNLQYQEDGTVMTWEHLFLEVPYACTMASSESEEALKAPFRDSKNVFRRALDELTIEAGAAVLELIAQGSLYRGEEHRQAVDAFILLKRQYGAVSMKDRDNWCWVESVNSPVARIRNSAIGTLLTDLSKDVDLDIAVTKFEKIMAPSNYKRPKALITKRMVEEAETKIEEMGFADSLGRRHAALEDVTVNNVLFVDRDCKPKLSGSVLDALKEDIPENPKKFDRVEEISIDDFVNNVLPQVSSIEVMMENKHAGNLMSLISPQDADAPSMFNWDNGFSWSYAGDIADSMKANVKKAGGNVEGVLRFSIQWNSEDDNPNDFDAHCIEPSGNLISYEGMRNIATSGVLDVDIITPNGVAVENITWSNEAKMLEGNYTFAVHNFSHCGGVSGFTAEIEYDGQIYSYEYPHDIKGNAKVIVAEIEFSKTTGIKFIKSLDSTTSTKEIWGVQTNKFTKISSMMFSPNHWDDQQGRGNKHYFFFMEECKNDQSPRGFYNEFLNPSLIKHKRVFEALGAKTKVEYSDNQLSGLGFSTTQRNSVVVRVSGQVTRVLKIKL